MKRLIKLTKSADGSYINPGLVLILSRNKVVSVTRAVCFHAFTSKKWHGHIRCSCFWEQIRAKEEEFNWTELWPRPCEALRRAGRAPRPPVRDKTFISLPGGVTQAAERERTGDFNWSTRYGPNRCYCRAASAPGGVYSPQFPLFPGKALKRKWKLEETNGPVVACLESVHSVTHWTAKPCKREVNNQQQNMLTSRSPVTLAAVCW